MESRVKMESKVQDSGVDSLVLLRKKMKNVLGKKSIDVKSLDALKEILRELKEGKKLTYSSTELRFLNVKYATALRPFLSRNGFIDKDSFLICDFDCDDMVKKIHEYNVNYQKKRKEQKNKEETLSNVFSVSNFSDDELVTELRNRGYEESYANVSDADLVTELRNRGFNVIAKKEVVTTTLVEL